MEVLISKLSDKSFNKILKTLADIVEAERADAINTFKNDYVKLCSDGSVLIESEQSTPFEDDENEIVINRMIFESGICEFNGKFWIDTLANKRITTRYEDEMGVQP